MVGTEGLNCTGAFVLFIAGWNEFSDSRIDGKLLAVFRLEGRRVGDLNLGYLLILETELLGPVIGIGAESLRWIHKAELCSVYGL